MRFGRELVVGGVCGVEEVLVEGGAGRGLIASWAVVAFGFLRRVIGGGLLAAGFRVQYFLVYS